MKPIIGITSNFSNDDIYFVNQGLGALEQTWSMIANDYAEAIIRSGGIPLVIPITDNEKYIKEVSHLIDGLLLTGGADIGTSLSKQRPNSKVGFISYERDEHEIKVLDEIYNNTDIPIFGVCRGMQFLNIFLGGKAILDLPSEGYLDHTIYRNKKFVPAHHVDIDKSSLLYELLGVEKLDVNSYHHQGIKELGKDLVSVAVSEDNVTEAIEHKNARERFIMAVQWHPEMMATKNDIHQRFFDKFIEEAGKRKDKSVR